MFMFLQQSLYIMFQMIKRHRVAYNHDAFHALDSDYYDKTITSVKVTVC